MTNARKVWELIPKSEFDQLKTDGFKKTNNTRWDVDVARICEPPFATFRHVSPTVEWDLGIRLTWDLKTGEDRPDLYEYFKRPRQ